MENFSHFLITRFNLNRTARWLEHRFEVFERYCLPSVAAQTATDFRWLCLFDAATPEPYRRRIASYRAVCPRFEAVYYTAAQTACLTESLRGTIRSVLAAEHGSIPPSRSADYDQSGQ